MSALKSIATAVLLTVSPVALGAIAMPTAAFAQQETIPTMSLTGTGQIMAEPDMAIVTSGLTTQGKTAREALDANNIAMNEIFSVLEAAGIERKDIQTSNFSVQPEYGRANSNSAARITSYAVSNNVTVTVRDLDNLGAMLDSFVTVGANQIYGVNFSVEETNSIYEVARKAAVADAIAKAELYADAAGIELTRIISISESGQPQPYAADMPMMRVAAESSVPVSGGQLTFSSDVSISWEIGQ